MSQTQQSNPPRAQELNPRFRQFVPTDTAKAISILTRVRQEPLSSIFERVACGREECLPLPKAMMELACGLATKADISTRQLVLFSTLNSNQAKAEDHVNRHADADVIHTTPAGYMLERLELFNPRLSPIDAELAYIPWNIAAIRLCLETTGENVIAFSEGATEFATYRNIEIAACLANPRVRTINGRNKIELAAEISSEIAHYTDAVLSANPAQVYTGTLIGQRYAEKLAKHAPIQCDATRLGLRDHFLRTYFVPLFERIRPFIPAHAPKPV